MSPHNIVIVFVLSLLVQHSYEQGSCTSPRWESTPGIKLADSVQTHLEYDRDLTSYCQPQCLAQQDCVTFDSTLINSRLSCYFSSSYKPLVSNADYAHYEYRRHCISPTGKSCSFLYIGEFTMIVGNEISAVTATSGEDCLTKCCDSNVCQVASYQGSSCQHSLTEQAAMIGRSLQTGWSQYMKVSVTRPTITTTSTTTTTTKSTTTPTTTTTTTTSSPPAGSNAGTGSPQLIVSVVLNVTFAAVILTLAVLLWKSKAADSAVGGEMSNPGAKTNANGDEVIDVGEITASVRSEATARHDYETLSPETRSPATDTVYCGLSPYEEL